jgi:hypothetical protein
LVKNSILELSIFVREARLDCLKYLLIAKNIVRAIAAGNMYDFQPFLIPGFGAGRCEVIANVEGKFGEVARQAE